MATLAPVIDPRFAENRQAFRRLPAPLWSALALLWVVDAIWLVVAPISLSGASYSAMAALLPLALLAGWGMLRLTGHPRVQMLMCGIAFILLAWPALRLFNHLTMSSAFPLADARLSAVDALIGFDWLGYATWLDGHPWLLWLMDRCYTGLTLYSIALFAVLMLTRDAVERCVELMILFFAGALICSGIGMFFPAVAAFAHYAPDVRLFDNVDPAVGSYHLAHMAKLRGDPAAVIEFASLPGLVTFPSFHTAMGVIAIYCARSNRLLFALSLAINLTMIASTPLFGSHYLIDVIAGTLIAIALIHLLRQARRNRDAHSSVQESAKFGEW